jgi:hypothetical protein
MRNVKSDRNGVDNRSTSPTAQERDRMKGRRSLERMGLMSVDQPPRNPYWDLDILGLMRIPSQRCPQTVQPRTEARPDAGEGPSWAEETPRSSWDREPLLL